MNEYQEHSNNLPSWLQSGTRIRHSKFGLGTIITITLTGTNGYDGRDAIEIDFDNWGTKFLDVEYGLPQIEPSSDDQPIDDYSKELSENPGKMWWEFWK